MMKLRFISIVIILSLAIQLQAKDHYSINVNIEGYADSVLLLTTYYGDKVIIVDTSYADKPGHFTFVGDTLIPGGIYMTVSRDKRKLFEFIINTDQQFSLLTDTTNYTMNMRINGSPENSLFFDYMKFNEKQYRINKILADSIKNIPKESAYYKILKHQMDSIGKLTVDYKLNIINNKPDLFITKLFNAMRDLEIPDSIFTSGDSSALYKYHKKHFWDFFDLSDERLLHTPLLSKKVDQYFKQLVVLHPDSVIVAIDQVIDKARPSEEVVSWLVWHFIAEYQDPEYMGFDVVFIHLADEYFQKEEIRNATPSIRKTIIDRANKMRPLVLGSPAPNLILVDTSNNYQSFHNLTNDYILIFFWDFDCGICKKEIQGLKDLLIRNQFDIGIFAINVNAELDKWKSSIREQGFIWLNVNATRSVTADYRDLYDTHGTPAIFLLDENRNIIAKQITTGQINQFLENHEKRTDKVN